MKAMEIQKIRFSDQTNSYQTSMIREILKASVSEKNLISFAGGLPDVSCLPIESIQNSMETALRNQSAHSLQYGESMGFLGLREWIAESYFGYFNESIKPSDLLITHGSQQALSLIGNIFLNRDSYVLMESPTYLGAIQAFKICTPNLIPIACDENGMIASDLLQRLQELKYGTESKGKQILFYINPVHQNPSTLTWTEQRIEEISKILDDNYIISIEDEAYRLLSYNQIRNRSITSFRKYKDLSIQIGSFSKILSPGFRLGWIRADKAILEQLEKLKQAFDLNSNQISQVALVHFFEIEKDFSYLERIKKRYEYKSYLFKELANHYLPEFQLSKITGGMFYWVKTPFMNSYPFFNRALTLGVAVVPGQEFDPLQNTNSFLRMNFTAVNESNMERGFEKLFQAHNQQR